MNRRGFVGVIVYVLSLPLFGWLKSKPKLQSWRMDEEIGIGIPNPELISKYHPDYIKACRVNNLYIEIIEAGGLKKYDTITVFLPRKVDPLIYNLIEKILKDGLKHVVTGINIEIEELK